MGKLTLMSRMGDTGETWDMGDESSVVSVRTRFNDLMKKGALAFETIKPGVAEQITEFKPEATEIVMVPQIKGGI